MIPLIDILIILSGISAAQAGPMRRYANTTSNALNAMTGVAYQPYAGSPSLSLASSNGVTMLPSSQAWKPPPSIPVAPSTSALIVNKASNAMATNAVPFQYQPIESDSADNERASPTMYNPQDGGPPTVFWTFGNQHIGTTVTITSTTYTTVSAHPQAVESSAPEEATTSQGRNTTTTSAHQSSWTFVYDPLTTSTASPTTETVASATTSEISAQSSPPSSNTQSTEPTSTFAYPYPSSSQQSDDSDSTAESSTTSSLKLPEVTTGDVSATQTSASDTSAIPGITIVPQNPSVIYITVTDAGATTTVTA
jgi:hypothetical protein